MEKDDFLSRMKRFDKVLPLEKIENARILLAGCGAVGTSALPILVNVGIKNLVMIDIDKFEKSNFAKTSMVIKFPDDYGKPKAETVAEYGRQAMLDGGTCVGITVDVMDLGIEFIKQFDYVICALDSPKAKLYLNRLCIQADVPMFEGGTNGLQAIERTYDHKHGCFGCTGEYKYESIGGCAVRYELDVQTGNIPTCQISSTIAAALVVNELVKSICDFNAKYNVEHCFYGDYGTFFSNTLNHREDCPYCSEETKFTEEITYIPGSIEDMTVKETMLYLNEKYNSDCYILLKNSFVTDGICPVCREPVKINKRQDKIKRSDLYHKTCFGKERTTEEGASNILTEISMDSDEWVLDSKMKDIGFGYGGVFAVNTEKGTVYVCFENDLECLLSKEFIRR